MLLHCCALCEKYWNRACVLHARLHAEPPYVFGHSLGGGLALMIEGRWPGSFAAIYVFEAPAVSTDSQEGVMQR